MNYRMRIILILGIVMLVAACGRENGSGFSLNTAIKQMQVMNDPKQWAQVWNSIGNGDVTELPDLELTEHTQKIALNGLTVELREDSRHEFASQWNEKQFLQPLEKVFTHKALYFQAYAELARHALSRDSKTGKFMYSQIPDDPQVLKGLSSPDVMLSYFYRGDNENAVIHAEQIRTSVTSARTEKEMALIIELTSRLELAQVDACTRALSVNEEELEMASHRESLRRLQERCKGTAVENKVGNVNAE